MKKIVFTKYSNDRADCFSIRTDIWQDEDGSRVVQKTPMHPQAHAHLENLRRWKERLDEVYREYGYVFNQGRNLEDGGVELEYVQGETLEERLDSLLDAGQPEAAAQELKDFVETARRPAQGHPFVPTDSFREVFGEADLPEGMESMAVTDIDLICSNVILGEPRTVIDYEWCFDFPVPVSYLVYRILHYYIHTKGSRAVLEGFDLFSWAGIAPEEIPVYEKMEQSFQRYINRAHVPLHEVFGEFAAGKLRLNEMLERERYHVSNETLQVFYDRGFGYSAADSYRLSMEHGSIETVIDIPSDVQGIRLDPGMEPGVCCLKKLNFVCEGGREIPAKFTANGVRAEADAVYFAQEDPQLLIQEIKPGAVKLQVSLRIYQADSFVVEKLLYKTREQAVIREKYRRQIRDMEDTKVWKAYRAYRRMVERKK